MVTPLGSGAARAQIDGGHILCEGGIVTVDLGQLSEAAVAAQDGDGRVDQKDADPSASAQACPRSAVTERELMVCSCIIQLPMIGTLPCRE